MMKPSFASRYLLLLALSVFCHRTMAQPSSNMNTLFDSDWLFHRGGALGAESPSFNDAGWRKVDLPHDWSIEDLPGTDSPFTADAISQVNGGFTTGGTGWYRKKFTVPENQKGELFFIEFEGVYMNSEVWINGEFLGNHPYGYTTFFYDISSKLKFDDINVVAVKVKNEGENSRWYSGSGIYRHVWLKMVPPVHIDNWGIYITTPEVSADQALISITTPVINNEKTSTEFTLSTIIIDPAGKVINEVSSDKSVGPGANVQVEQEIKITKPELWSPDSPSLYKAVSEIMKSGVKIYSEETEFGIRSLSFDVTNGFRLNGNVIKLKGGCVHHDNGILGSKAYDRAEERRVAILKSSGYNAIRTSHNPPSPAFLKACDHLGMLVLDEAFDMWKDEKNPEDYHLYFDDWWKRDIESMVLRDRNHPSVILWSIGNEIPEREKPGVIEVEKMLYNYVRLLDPTRPVTSAVNNLGPAMDQYISTLDVAGYNYASLGELNGKDLYETDHDRVPARIMVGTESFPLEAFQSWMPVRDHSYVIGDFVWTAWDYIGEASIGWRGYFQKHDFFPWNLAFCGDIDICGWKRPQSYYRDVLWKKDELSIWVVQPKPSFEINTQREDWSRWHWHDVLDSWNWKGMENTMMDINVYSSCDQVELFLNGKSLGKKTTDRTSKYIAEWKVPYAAGTLKAIGFTGRKQVASFELHTAGEPSQIKLTADRNSIRSDGQDLSYITAELNDNSGIRNPLAENLLKFEVSGPATIIGVGNANPVSLESYSLPQRKAWLGKCLAVIKSSGTKGRIILKASSDGLQSASIEIECK